MINRKGCFAVDVQTLESSPEILAKALAEIQFIPLKVEYNYYDHCFNYIGISSKFDEVKEGEIIGMYEVVVCADETGYKGVTVNRKV